MLDHNAVLEIENCKMREWLEAVSPHLMSEYMSNKIIDEIRDFLEGEATQ